MNEESLFAAVLEKPTQADRQAYLQVVCDRDTDLFRRMNRLLASHELAGGILDRTRYINGVAVNPTADCDQSGTVIGPYVLKELLGEGGFGQVFVAEQYHPVKREVAIKLIKPGMNSREVLARFESERQALAMMEHDHIARVLDAGATEEGRPYFVMELVRGAPLTEFADAMLLNTQARLNLFVSVCQAVHHAHQKGILHRDLKPSNVLVTVQDAQPVVKVIDFGVAKALYQPLIDDPFVTHAQQMIGTPAYMSPEQAGMNGQDVDTRTDIYSLGVMLYELLVGATPFDRERLCSAGYDEMRRIIREEEPLCPSTRISTLGMLATTVSTHRQASPRQLSQLFRGELDWIVMKAIEKDRDRRYSTVSDLARDVERYLNGEPVEASPSSSLYRLSKFLQRHRQAVLAAAAMLMLLIAGIVGTTVGMFRAWDAEHAARQWAEGEARERHRAVTAEAEAVARTKQATLEADSSSALVEFLRHDLLSPARFGIQDPAQIPLYSQLTIHEALDRAANRLHQNKMGRPEIEGRIRYTIGASYLELGLFSQATNQLRQAVELLKQHLGQEHVDTMSAMNALGQAHRLMGNKYDAIAMHEKLRDLQLLRYDENHPSVLTTMNHLAMDYRDLQRFEEALVLMEQVHAAYVKAHGHRHSLTLNALQNLALIHMDLKHTDKALAMHEQVLEDKLALLGPDDPDCLIARNNLAVTYWQLKRLDKSIPLFESLVPQYEKTLGKTHLETYRVKANLGVNYRDQRRMTEAMPLLLEAYEGSKQYPSLRQHAAAELLHTYIQTAEREKGKALVAESIAAARKAFRPQTKSLAGDLTNLGSDLIKLKAWAEAEALLREAITYWKVPPEEPGNLYIAKSLLGEALLGRAQQALSPDDRRKLHQEAETLLLECHAAFQANRKSRSPFIKNRSIKTIDLLIAYYQRTNQPEAVQQWQKEKVPHSGP